MIQAAHAFELARAEDDGPIRALLRASPLAGRVRLSFEREPSLASGAAAEGERVHTFVCRDPATGALLGLARRSVWRVWLDGVPCRLGYLSNLRRAPGVTVTRGLLQAGFAACASTRRTDELDFDLTSILDESANARRLLERGLPGLPRYERLCGFTTFTLASARAARRAPDSSGLELRPAGAEEAGLVADFLTRELARHPLASVCRAADLVAPHPAPADIQLALRSGRLVGCLALWDQRPFKQTVVRGYAPGLALARVAWNPLAALLGRPVLPAPGTVLPLAFLSHLAVAEDDPRVFAALLGATLAEARRRRIEYASLGLADGHALLPALRAGFRARELGSALYLVHAPGRAAEPGRTRLVHGVPRVEVARL